MRFIIREYIAEIVDEKNAIKCTFDGLTEKKRSGTTASGKEIVIIDDDN